MKINTFLLGLLSFFLTNCKENKQTLPILGERKVVEKNVNGEMKMDTIYTTIPDFSFVNQYGETITQKNTENKIIVVDFFFTHCPSICPKMKAEMLKIYNRYKDKNEVVILSHSIDPKRDSVNVLFSYAKKLGIAGNTWHLLTGEKDSIFGIAKKYLAEVAEDEDAPGGLVHSGNFILIDKQKRIRGYYDGTTDEGAEKMIKDIEYLLNEK